MRYAGNVPHTCCKCAECHVLINRGMHIFSLYRGKKFTHVSAGFDSFATIPDEFVSKYLQLEDIFKLDPRGISKTFLRDVDCRAKEMAAFPDMMVKT